MRIIDLDTWSRRDHFEFFRTWDLPHFNLCANVDITAFYPAVKQRGVSFTVATLYVLARVANTIPEFRYRIRGANVVEHEVVHPSTTILLDDDLFRFCTFEYTEDFAVFAPRATERIAQVKAQSEPINQAEPDNLLYMTSIPWVTFTSLMHPLVLSPADSIPRLAWGKYFDEGGRKEMPLSVHAHHGLVDGIHAGRFFELVQDYLHHPERVLGET
jgi:chloramphenicol O-acetyltransferase type A